MRNIRGLSLTELLFTLTILVVVMSLCTPSFGLLRQRFTSNAISDEIIGMLNAARYLALISGETVTLCGSSNRQLCDAQWSTRMLAFTDSNGNGHPDENERIVREFMEIPAGGKLTWRSFRNKPYLQFLPSGLTYYQNGNFTYCPADKNPALARQWVINQSGRVRVAVDNDGDGVVEDSSGRNIRCL